MAASTSILADKLHEYPQQDVIDGSGGASASILDDCINQNDGTICGTEPLGLCCRQKCLQAYSFGFMCPRLCPVTAETGDTCTQRTPENSEEAADSNSTALGVDRFCCAKM